MSKLGQRLTQLRKQSGQHVVDKSAVITARALAERLQNSRAKSTEDTSRVLDDAELARKFNGEVLSPGLLLFKTGINLFELHGVYSAIFPQGIRHIDHVAENSSLLFIDTETTGLSTAAGTLVFLCGTAEIKGNTLQLEQVLLTRMSAETQLLSWLNLRCENKTHIVSYNGKTFDIPLLATRFKMMRMKSNILSLSHIDLLHWIRRLHQKQLVDCRLPSAEAHCLGFQRIDDMPGSEAPFVWQQLIRFGNISRIKSLLAHHAYDIISLAGLLHYAEHTLENYANASYDALSLARYYQRIGQPDMAERVLNENYQTLTADGLFLLSTFYRQKKQWDKAINIWLQLREQGYVAAIESLAKYFEHYKKEFLMASKYAKELLLFKNSAEHQKRLLRLESKLGSKVSLG